MATRKTASKTPTTKAAKTSKAESKGEAAARKRPAPATAAKPAAAPRSKPTPAVLPAPGESAGTQTPPAQAPTGETRYRWIAHAAYLRAEKRGFAPGHEIDDWLAAEADFLAAHDVSRR